MKKFIKYWRKYGVILLLLMIVFGNSIVGCAGTFLMLTVPCGFKVINKNWWLWYPRQIFFLYFALKDLEHLYRFYLVY